MDIDLLAKMVKELILDTDEVTLPGVGTFVAELVPATFSDKGYTINPPYRRLYFRQKDGQDDTLARFYSTSNGISLEDSARILGEFLSEMRSILEDKKTIVFPGLGRLRATKENNFFFVPDEDLDIYPAGYGLEPVSLKTHQETREEVSATLSGLAGIINEQKSVPVEAEREEPAEVEAEVEAETVAEPEKLEAETVPAEAIPEPAVAEPTTTEPLVTEPLGTKSSEPVVKKGKAWLWWILGILATVLILLALYVAASRMYPGIFDNFLYSPDELRILEYPQQ